MVASQISRSVSGSRAGADRQPKATNSHHAYRVIEVARNELEQLLKQRSLINRKVKQVKRTVEGLTILLGESSTNGNDSKCVCGGQAATLPLGTGAGTVQTSKTQVARIASATAREAFTHVARNKDLKPKLKRACRIALLESDVPSTATQIYDRITRRRSYQMNRYKHPLAQVIATLCDLAEREEIESVVKGGVRHWRWNRETEEVKNEFAANGLYRSTAWKSPTVPANAPINAHT